MKVTIEAVAIRRREVMQRDARKRAKRREGCCADEKFLQMSTRVDVEVIPIQKVNEAYERLVKSDVKYRFCIDVTSLKSE